MLNEVGKILKHEQIADGTYLMVIESSVTEEMNPGQFVNLRIEGFLLRRPISISSIDPKSFTIVYKVVGEGTQRLSEMQVGETIEVLGPLGHGYPVHPEEENILLIGGGCGVPPLYEIAKRYRALDKKVDVVLGFSDQASVFYVNEFEALGACVVVATMDGSYGVKGTVIDAIKEKGITTDFVYSCGPKGMLKAVESNYTRGYLSFEARMACGVGACMACVAKDKKEENLYHRICKEGPVFEIGKVEI